MLSACILSAFGRFTPWRGFCAFVRLLPAFPGPVCGSRLAFASFPGSFTRSAALRLCSLSVLASYMARYGLLFRFVGSCSPLGLPSLCGRFLRPFDLWQRFRLLGLVCPFEFRQLWTAFGRGCSVHLWPGSLAGFGYNLPVVFWFPFGTVCGFFCFQGSKIPGAGRRSRFPFSASGL